MKKQVCVVGMGRFGATAAKELYQSGHDVLAIDNDETKIQDLLGQVTYAVKADATNESVLRELGVPDFDVAIVTLGYENIQASILITVLLKSLGIPFIGTVMYEEYWTSGYQRSHIAWTQQQSTTSVRSRQHPLFPNPRRKHRALDDVPRTRRQ